MVTIARCVPENLLIACYVLAIGSKVERGCCCFVRGGLMRSRCEAGEALSGVSLEKGAKLSAFTLPNAVTSDVL